MKLIEKSKICTKCKKERSVDEFHKDRSKKDFLSSHCKECHSKRSREYYKANSKKICAATKRWQQANPKKVRKQKRRHYKANKESIDNVSRLWRERNIDKVRKNGRKAIKKRLKTLKGNLCNRISCSMRNALREKKNGYHWEDLVDYTFDDLKKHLEKQFQPGMTWDKFLNGEIHIDHKIPISAFNFKKPEDIDFKKCWSLSNLQPLWANDNQTKWNKLDKPFQPSLIFN